MSPVVFRMERGLMLLNMFAAVVIAALGVFFAAYAASEGAVWLIAISAAGVVGGIVLAWRVAIMRVSFDSEELLIVGYLRTHRIPRRSVLEVERFDLDRPKVRWAPVGGTDRWSVLSPLQLQSTAIVPRSMFLRRHRFLGRLRRWAPGDVPADIRPGVETQFMDLLGRVFLVVWESPVLRVVLAAVLAGAAAWFYWFGWEVVTAVIDGTQDFSRGSGSAFLVVGACLELAYWLLPLSRRRTRLWHVILAVAVAPLAVLTVVALFS